MHVFVYMCILYIYIYVYTCWIWGWGSKKVSSYLSLFTITDHHLAINLLSCTIEETKRSPPRDFWITENRPGLLPWSSFRNIVGPSRSTWTRPWTCRRPWPGACNGYHHRSLRALCIPSSKMMNGVWAEITGKVKVWASGWLHPLDIRANIIYDTRMLVVGWLSGRSVMTWVFWEGEGLWRGRPVRIEGPWDSVPMKS